MSSDFRDFGGRRQEIPWDRVLMIAPVAIAVLAVVYLVLAAVYTVEPYEEAVVLQFGKYNRTVGPGLQFCIPLVEKVHKVSIQEHSVRLPLDAAGKRSSAVSEDETLMLTGDLDAVLVEWTIQWKVTQPDQFLFRFYDAKDEGLPERVIATIAHTVMNRLVGDYSIDEVLTEARGEIAEKARLATQQILDIYQCGVGIVDLQMQRTTPPGKVRGSYEQVNASEQLREQLKNEADKERNRLLPKAEADKDRLVREAEGYAKRRWAESSGEIAALLAKYRAYQRAPEVTRQRLYLEAMAEVLGQIESKVIVDEGLKGIVPVLSLEEKVRND